MIRNNAGRETYCKGCSSPFRSCRCFFGMARTLGSTSIGKHSVGYCLFVNARCAFHRAKPWSQINPSVISKGMGMVWPNPLMAWELHPCKLFPGLGFQILGIPSWLGALRVEEALDCWRPVWNVWDLTRGWESSSSVADTWSKWEKSWTVWVVPFEILMGKRFLSSSRFLLPAWTVQSTWVLQQKLTVRSWVACG